MEEICKLIDVLRSDYHSPETHDVINEMASHIDRLMVERARLQDVLRRVLERWDYLGSPQEYDNNGVGELEKLHREACEVAGIEPW